MGRRAAPLLALLMIGCQHTSVPTQDAPPSINFNLTQAYKNPIGERGLEPTSQLLALAGKRVRITGFMVHEEAPTPGRFLIASLPVQMAEIQDGPADELPAATLFVHVARDDASRIVPFRRGLWQVSGILAVGAFEERDGRVSYLRLELDPTNQRIARTLVRHQEPNP